MHIERCGCSDFVRSLLRPRERWQSIVMSAYVCVSVHEHISRTTPVIFTDNALYSIAFGTHTKTAKPIEMPFGVMTWVGRMYRVLDGENRLLVTFSLFCLTVWHPVSGVIFISLLLQISVAVRYRLSSLCQGAVLTMQHASCHWHAPTAQLGMANGRPIDGAVTCDEMNSSAPQHSSFD